MACGEKSSDSMRELHVIQVVAKIRNAETGESGITKCRVMVQSEIPCSEDIACMKTLNRLF